MKRKILSIALLLSLVLPILGIAGWLFYQKFKVRQEVRQLLIEEIDKEKLSIIRISKRNKAVLKWEHSKEFEYKGEMFDMVFAEEHSDSLYYWCWPDHQETELNRQLASLTRSILESDPRRQENKSRVYSFLKSLFINHSVDFGTVFTEILDHKEGAIHNWNSIDQSPLEPPPRIS